MTDTLIKGDSGKSLRPDFNTARDLKVKVNRNETMTYFIYS